MVQFRGHNRDGRGRREAQLRGVELEETEVVHRVAVDLGGFLRIGLMMVNGWVFGKNMKQWLSDMICCKCDWWKKILTRLWLVDFN